jgi:hypothetical protein
LVIKNKILDEVINMNKIKAEFNTLFEYFNLKWLKKDNLIFKNWLVTDSFALDKDSELILKHIEPYIEKEIEGWFEEELKMNLLSPIFILSQIKESEKIGLFFERPITAELEQGKISVVTDCMVSSIFGVTAPQTPYFFMQEFKKSKGDKQDPEGQMLAAMIAAQHLNNNGKVMYGSYVIGRDWFFAILDGKNYSRSESFRLTQPKELRQVILTLRKLKQIILTELMD